MRGGWRQVARLLFLHRPLTPHQEEFEQAFDKSRQGAFLKHRL